MIFWTTARPRPVPLRFEVKNGRKIRSRAPGSIRGPLSLTEILEILLPRIDLRLDHDHGSHGCVGTRLDRITQQIGKRLPQQHLVALDGAETGREA